MAEFLIRKAREEDIDTVEALYEKIHDAEENGTLTIGWIREIYPVRQTAEDVRNFAWTPTKRIKQPVPCIKN